jgi:hypothetical protein
MKHFFYMHHSTSIQLFHFEEVVVINGVQEMPAARMRIVRALETVCSKISTPSWRKNANAEDAETDFAKTSLQKWTALSVERATVDV